MAKERSYLCIDLKSYYASVECVERGLDPLTAKLVVADPERTEKTICLAVSPALKAQGVRNRCRVFEIPDGIDYIMAKPRMALYMQVAARIYGIYLRYVPEEDIHVYSIDEVLRLGDPARDIRAHRSDGDLRPRQQPLSGQDRAGHQLQARAGSCRRPYGRELPERAVASQADHRFLAHRPGDGETARPPRHRRYGRRGRGQ